MTETSTDEKLSPIVSAFVNQVQWLADKYKPSKGDVLSWLATRLKGEFREEVQRLLLIDHPLRKNTEKLLIEFLQNVSLSPAVLVKSSDTIGRQTNWARTFSDAISDRPTKYWNQEKVLRYEPDVIGALKAIGQRWLDELNEAIPEERFNSRIERLSACLKFAGKYPGRSNMYDANIRYKLSCIPKGEKLARNLTRLNHLMRQKINDDEKYDEIERIGEIFNDHFKGLKPENADNLLEVIATLSVGFALVNLGWNFETEAYNLALKEKGELNLRNEELGLTCRIYKGKPDGQTDRAIEIRRSVLGIEARGLQPDILIEFKSFKNNHSVTIIADAKNNSTGNGEFYARTGLDAIYRYFVAYGQIVGLKFEDNNISTKYGGPAGILFLYQMPHGEKENRNQTDETIVKGLGLKDNEYGLHNEKLENLLSSIIKLLPEIFKSDCYPQVND